MTRKLPPLNSLRAFTAAASNASFTKAALELGVTQGAISKQIKLLEEYLGLALFERKHQHLVLTKHGKKYLASISKALDTIEQATDKLILQPDAKDVLHINILPSLSSRWLIPMLDDFKNSHPYTVKIETGDGAIDFDKTNADIAIRVAPKNNWKKFHTEIIMSEDLLPVCAPEFKSTHNINNINDLVKNSLLQHTSRPAMWEKYLQAVGYKGKNIKHVLGFEHFFMLIQAVEDGLGVALIPRFLIEKELEEGKLVIALHTNFKSDYKYYLIYPKQKASLKKIKDFARWIKVNCGYPMA